jgi:hypothetical protein
MDPIVVTALVCALCAAGIGAIYFIWLRKGGQPAQPSQPGQK